MDRRSINIRKSYNRHSGSDIENILGIKMEEHHEEVQSIIAKYM